MSPCATSWPRAGSVKPEKSPAVWQGHQEKLERRRDVLVVGVQPSPDLLPKNMVDMAVILTCLLR